MVAQHNWTGDIKKIEFSVKYTYSTEEVQSLSINQRHCVFPQEIKLLSDTNYTYSMCMTECRMKRAKALCGCVPFFYKDFGNTSVTPIKLANRNELYKQINHLWFTYILGTEQDK